MGWGSSAGPPPINTRPCPPGARWWHSSSVSLRTQTFPASLVPGVCVPAPTHSPCPGPCPAPGRGRRRGGWRAGGWAAACWAALCPLVSQVTVLSRYSGHGGACSSTDLPPAAVLTRPARHQSPLSLRPRHLHHHHLLLLLGSNKHCLPDIIYRAMPMVQTMGPSCPPGKQVSLLFYNFLPFLWLSNVSLNGNDA